MKGKRQHFDLTACDYRVAPREKLFHYCPLKALDGILTSRSLWLSGLDSLNDESELVWGRQLVTRELRRHRNNFDRVFGMTVHAMFARTDVNITPLVFSLSTNGDLLSQWRAYASDGEGVAIEFDAEKMSAATPVNMKRILYDRKKQTVLVRRSLRTFYSWWLMDDEAATRALSQILLIFAMDLVSLKHPSFFEEQEVRMVHLLVRDGDWFRDPGGHTSLQASVAPAKVQRRTVGEKVTPYIAMPICPQTLITGVVLGPRSPVSPAEMRERLRALGISKPCVRRSQCPYR